MIWTKEKGAYLNRYRKESMDKNWKGKGEGVIEKSKSERRGKMVR